MGETIYRWGSKGKTYSKSKGDSRVPIVIIIMIILMLK